MFSDILTKERSIGETKDARNLLNRLAGRTEIISYISKGILGYPVDGGLARMTLADDGEILRGDTELLSKILYRVMLDFALLQ